jgi:DNA-binding MarR family transcriptional regulator
VKVLPFDPIEEARRQWVEHGWVEAADGMAIVTSIMRVQQIYLARIDAVLRSFDLTFARFELLSLISFSRTGALPLSKVGARLQVHPASVTSAVDRLETQGFVRRLPHQTDRRMTLVEIRPVGRAIVGEATMALNEKVFAALGLSVSEMEKLSVLLRNVRDAEGDFAT